MKCHKPQMNPDRLLILHLFLANEATLQQYDLGIIKIALKLGFSQHMPYVRNKAILKTIGR